MRDSGTGRDELESRNINSTCLEFNGKRRSSIRPLPPSTHHICSLFAWFLGKHLIPSSLISVFRRYGRTVEVICLLLMILCQRDAGQFREVVAKETKSFTANVLLCGTSLCCKCYYFLTILLLLMYILFFRNYMDLKYLNVFFMVGNLERVGPLIYIRLEPLLH